MASKREELTTELVATDRASSVITNVADQIEKLDGSTADIDVTAEDRATAEVRDLMRRIEGLTAAEQEVVLAAEARKLESEVKRSLVLLGQLDGETFEAVVDAKNNAEAKLEGVRSELAAVERTTATAKIEATDNASGDIDRAQDKADTFDRTSANAKIDATAGAGLSDIFDKVDAVPSSLSSGMEVLRGGAGKAGAIGLAVGAMVGLVQQATDWGTEVGEVAQLTGDSTENVSGFLSVWRNAGFEKGDLLDIVAQMVGVLEQSPEIAEDLGIKLDGSMTPLEMLKQAIEGLNSGQLSANDRILQGSRLFGEEGVRQINALVTMVDGDLSGAISDVPEARILSEDEVAKAQEMKREFSEMVGTVQAITLELGGSMLPLVAEITSKLNELGVLEAVINGPIVTAEAAGSLVEAARNSGILEDRLREATRFYDLAQSEWGDFADLQREGAEATDEQSASLEHQIELLDQEIGRLGDEAEALEERAELLEDQGDAYLDLFEAEQERADAVEDLTDRQAEYNAAVLEFGQSSEEATDALRGVADGAQEVAEATVAQSREQARANSTTMTARQELDTFNASLLRQAGTMQGEARQAILNRIADINKIPREVMTEIEAAVAEGDLALASRLLNEASAPRKAYLQAELTAASAAETRKKANELAVTRTVTFVGRPAFDAIWNAIASIRRAVSNLAFGGFNAGVFASGTESAPAGYAWVGEDGPELRRLSGGEQIIPSHRSREMAAAAAGSSSSGPSTVILHLPQGTTPAGTMNELRRYVNRQGPALPGEMSP